MSLDRTALTLALSAVAMSWGGVALAQPVPENALDAVFKLYTVPSLPGYQSWVGGRVASTDPPSFPPDDHLFLGLKPNSGDAVGAYAFFNTVGQLVYSLMSPMPAGATFGATVAGQVVYGPIAPSIHHGAGYSNKAGQAEEGPLYWLTPASQVEEVTVDGTWKGRLVCANAQGLTGGYYVLPATGVPRPIVRVTANTVVPLDTFNTVFSEPDRGEVLAISDGPAGVYAAGWVGDSFGRRWAALWAYDSASGTFSPPEILDDAAPISGRPATAHKVESDGAGWRVWGSLGAAGSLPPQPFTAWQSREEPPVVKLLERPGLAHSVADVRVMGLGGIDAVLSVRGGDGLPYLLVEPRPVGAEPILPLIGCAVDIAAFLEPGTPRATSTTQLTGIANNTWGSFGGTDYPTADPSVTHPVWLARDELAWRLSTHEATTVPIGAKATGDDDLWGAFIDGRYLTVNQGPSPVPGAPRIRVELQHAMVDPAPFGNLTFRCTARLADPATYVLKLSLFDFQAQAWVDQPATPLLTQHMKTHDFTVTGSISQYREPFGIGQARLRGRLSVLPIGPVPPTTPAKLEVEQARFLARP